MAEYKKSRTPYYLKDDDYDNFLQGIEKYHDDHGADPDFYPHWALLEPLITAFHAAYQSFVAARQLIKATKTTFDDEVKALRENMVQLRRQLPVLLRDESILGLFGLEEDVPTDVDLLLVNARICRDYWATLSVPAPPPEYLPVQDKLDAMATLITAVEDAQAAYADAIRDREEARIVKDEAREACNAEERNMFGWYRGIWTDPEDDRWSATPWGASSGGNGGGATGTKWDDVPVGVKIEYLEFPEAMLVLSIPEYTGNSGFDVRIEMGPIGGPAPTMPGEDTMTDVPFPVQYAKEIMHGMTYYAWVRARNGEEVTDWAEAVSVNVE